MLRQQRLSQASVPVSLHEPLEGVFSRPYHALCLAVGRWVEGHRSDLADPVGGHEVLELPQGEAVPLSETKMSGCPWFVNSFLRAQMAAVAEVELTGLTSSHFEYESTVIVKVCPWNGLAKSTWTRDHGVRVDSQSLAGVLGGDGQDSWM